MNSVKYLSPRVDGEVMEHAPSETPLPLVLVELVELDEHGRQAAFVTFNRPDQLNAMTWGVVRELDAALRSMCATSSVRIVFITGSGRAFSAGGDVKAYAKLQRDAADFTAFVDEYCEVMRFVEASSIPVVALVNGICAAGGLELLIGCDFAWAAESARIGDMHINFAQIGGAGVMARLPRLIGSARALELVFSGEMLGARDALAWGIVNRVVPDADLRSEAISFARSIAKKSPRAVHNMKRMIRDGLSTDVANALRLERDRALLYILSRPDSMEGIASFIEKRDAMYEDLV